MRPGELVLVGIWLQQVLHEHGDFGVSGGGWVIFCSDSGGGMSRRRVAATLGRERRLSSVGKDTKTKMHMLQGEVWLQCTPVGAWVVNNSHRGAGGGPVDGKPKTGDDG